MKVFTEQQRFNQWWLYVIFALFLIGILLPLKINFEEVKAEGTDRILFLISFLIIFLAAIFIFLMRLNTKIDEKGVGYQFYPFHRNYKILYWKDINAIYVRKYLAIREYGGWGFKSGIFNIRGRGVAYSVKGDKGIQIVLNNGKKILIGTQKENEAKRVINTYKSNIKE